MTARERLERLPAAAARRPVLTLGIVLALAIAGGVLALGLRPSAATDTLVSSSSPSYRATAQDQRQFGDDAVIVLVREPLSQLVRTGDLDTLTRLEACLAGQYVVRSAKLRAYTPAAAGSHAAYGGPSSPCGKLMRAKPAQVVYGPGTFLNRAVAAVNGGISSMMASASSATRAAYASAHKLALAKGLSGRQAAAAGTAAAGAEYERQLGGLEQLAAGSGVTAVPSIDGSSFVPDIVFGPAPGAAKPKPRFHYLFPTADSALIQVRLRSSLSAAQQARAISWIRQAVGMGQFRLAHGGTYTVGGVPVVVNDLAGQITGAIGGLLIAALLVMAAALLLVFRNRMRLLPLAVALAAAGITFGLLAAVGAQLTMASIAVLPILIGLGVDYGIQFQARAQEEQTVGRAAGRTVPIVSRAAGRAVPTLATAALATATGFLVLLLSPVPMVRGFGVLLVVGIAIALACALTAGPAALALRERGHPFGSRGAGVIGASLRGAGEILGSSVRGAGEIMRGGRGRGRGQGRGRPDPPARWAARVVGAVMQHPGPVLAVAVALAVGGWFADGHTGVQSDVTKLVPQSMVAMRNLDQLERVTGVSGEIDVAVRGDDVATPATVTWMVDYENALLTHYGYHQTTGCAHATLCPALSLPDLFSTTGGRGALTKSQIDGLLSSVPSYFSRAVLSPDRRAATLAFGIRLMPLARQQRVIDYMRAHLHPPPGVTTALTGLPVLAAQANASLASSGRRLETLGAGLLAVGLVLLVVFRRVRRAVVPMVPIALATGWSALILYLIGIPLNPMSATLGTLVIAISTEFSVLLSERFRQERAAGHDASVALARTYRSTGAAVLASGITAIVGFGVLVFSNITMLRDFGFVTLVDLTVSLGGVLLVLPAVLAVSERRDAPDRLRARSDRRGSRMRARRRASVA